MCIVMFIVRILGLAGDLAANKGLIIQGDLVIYTSVSDSVSKPEREKTLLGFRVCPVKQPVGGGGPLILPFGLRWPLTKAPKIAGCVGGVLLGVARGGLRVGGVGAWILSISAIRPVMLGGHVWIRLILFREGERILDFIIITLGNESLSSPKVRTGGLTSAAGSYWAGICLGGPVTRGSGRLGPRYDLSLGSRMFHLGSLPWGRCGCWTFISFRCMLVVG